MKTESLSCLCLFCLLPLIPLTTAFFCHVLVTLLASLAGFTSYLSDRTQTVCELFQISSGCSSIRRSLRSSSDSRFRRMPSFRLKSFGQRKFSYQASVRLNSFPNALRHLNSTSAFKSALKTFFFLPSSSLFLTHAHAYGILF